MKPIVLAILGGAALLLLFSCANKQNDDITQSTNKVTPVHTVGQMEHLSNMPDALITIFRNY